MESGRSSTSVSRPAMVPKGYVRRSESCALVQFLRPCVPAWRDHRRLTHPLLLENLRGAPQEVAAHSLATPVLVDRKQADAGGLGRRVPRIVSVDVQRDVADRAAVPIGNDHV